MKKLGGVAALLTTICLMGSFATANSIVDPIISIKNATGCSGTGPGGTICGGTGSTPLSLAGIENGSVVLQAVIGTQTAPVYEVVNNTGSVVTSFSFSFNLEAGGSFASNQFLTCQVQGGFSGDSCTISATNGTVLATTGKSYGPPVNFPVIYTFSGLNIASGATFDIGFASFGNNDTGLQTGGTLTSVPEPSSLLLFGSGMCSIVGIVQRRLRKSTQTSNVPLIAETRA